MKGTLFSADFIKDENANLRLLEINTDTAFISNTLESRFDFTAFKTVLSNNNITSITVVYKLFQKNFVELLENYIEANATFITSFVKQIEDKDTIYPSAVVDASDKFILRLAYDENALFDSTYAKQRENLQKLFYDNSDTGSVPQFYYSGSEYEINTIGTDINGHSVLPDFVLKDKSEAHRPLNFVKLGNSESSSLDRINDFLNTNFNKEGKTLERYHYNTADLSNNKVSGIREFGIVYGTSISYVSIGNYRVESFFEMPTSESLDYITDDNLANIYSHKHYFELTSNYLRVTNDEGIYQDEVAITSADGEILVGDVSQSNVLKSFFINGLPDTDDVDVYGQWFSTGSTLPSGSYVTSSVVESVSELSEDNYGIIGQITLDSSEKIYASIGKNFLVYSTGSDEFRFVPQYKIAPDDHFLVNESAEKIGISDNNIIVLEDSETGSLYRIDVETTDSYFISSSASSFIVHNAPCFGAGTQVSIADGEKAIEDVITGDEVWTYNHKTNENELNRVLRVMVKDWEETIKYTLSDGNEIIATPDHPFWVVELNDYASHNPEATLSDSGLAVQQIEVGHTLKHIDSNPNDVSANVTISSIEAAETQTVYNLSSVEKNSNFYANGMLVHNRIPSPTCFAAGTKISLGNGDVKNIEDIVVGDVVKGWDSTKSELADGEVIAIDSSHTVWSHSEACKSLGDEPSLYTINDTGIEFTPEHPFLTKEGWKSLVPDPNQEPYKSEQEPKVLGLGDFIMVNGEWEEVTEIRVVRSDADEKVYNITVKDLSSYIADGIIVHNK